MIVIVQYGHFRDMPCHDEQYIITTGVDGPIRGVEMRTDVKRYVDNDTVRFLRAIAIRMMNNGRSSL